jgi:hypothetical protein
VVDITVTFPAGATNGNQQCFNVSIINDMAFEKNESFLLGFGDVEAGVVVHDSETTISILDNDCELLT